jgi:hypothetical protein
MALKLKASKELEEARPMSTEDLQRELNRVMRRHDFTEQPVLVYHAAASIYLEGVVSWCVRWVNSHPGYSAKYEPFLGILGGPTSIWHIELRREVVVGKK